MSGFNSVPILSFRGVNLTKILTFNLTKILTKYLTKVLIFCKIVKKRNLSYLKYSLLSCSLLKINSCFIANCSNLKSPNTLTYFGHQACISQIVVFACRFASIATAVNRKVQISFLLSGGISFIRFTVCIELFLFCYWSYFVSREVLFCVFCSLLIQLYDIHDYYSSLVVISYCVGLCSLLLIKLFFVYDYTDIWFVIRRCVGYI